MNDKIRRLLVDEQLVRNQAEADRVVNGWLLNAATPPDADFERLSRLIGGRQKAGRIVNRLLEVIR